MGGETEFGPDGVARPYTGSSPYRYGGPDSLIIKIEIDGWERGGRIPTGGSPSRDYGPAPAGWVAGTGPGSDPYVRWPFDPYRPLGNAGVGPLKDGDYVRIVGTLWEDQVHGSSGVTSCWQDGPTIGRAHMEIHPVDYLARVVPAVRAQPSTYTALTLCDNASINAMDIMPPAGGPPGAPIGLERMIVGDFTTQTTSPPLSFETLADRVRVTVGAPNWQDSSGSHKGKFFALFRVFWNVPCPTGKTLCQSSCVDPQSFQNDEGNCGRCGLTCQGGTSCSAGKCVCPVGWTLCNGVCVNPTTDSSNCGGCGSTCYPYGVGFCTGGSCACPSSAPTLCSDGNSHWCENLQTSNENCGACGRHCINGTCKDGTCVCPDGLQLCSANEGVDRICTDVSSDPAHCGHCDNPCPDNLNCSNKTCGPCPVGYQMCSGSCTNTDNDDNNCGGCGHKCRRGTWCDQGACTRRQPRF
jgi:hypothetical protein